MAEKESFGALLKRLRKERGFTQETLGEALGVTYVSVGEWERGGAYPEGFRFRDIADCLNYPLNDLLIAAFGETPEPNAPRLVIAGDRVRLVEEGQPDVDVDLDDAARKMFRAIADMQRSGNPRE